VEEGPAGRVLADPMHPYARILRDASPLPDPARRAELPRIIGEIPSAANPPPGCPFHPRCPQAMPVCSTTLPRWTIAPGEGQGGVACHLHG
jgi:peptide/nickel transport system ATP-binding protein